MTKIHYTSKYEFFLMNIMFEWRKICEIENASLFELVRGLGANAFGLVMSSNAKPLILYSTLNFTFFVLTLNSRACMNPILKTTKSLFFTLAKTVTWKPMNYLLFIPCGNISLLFSLVYAQEIFRNILRMMKWAYRKYWKVSRAYFNFLTFFLRVYFQVGLLFRGHNLSWAKILGRKIPSSYSER